MLRVAFLTVGDPQRKTGGYLYHARVFAGLPAYGIDLEQIVASEADLQSQLAAASGFGQRFNPGDYDLVMVDALARAVSAPWIAVWQTQRPLIAMVHELPSVAGGSQEYELEAPLLQADCLIAVSRHGQSILEGRGVPSERIRIVSPGCDRVTAILDLHNDFLGSQDEQSRVRVLCVAQWIERKGITDLLQAWSSNARPGAILELVGENDADPAYARQVWQLLHSCEQVQVRGVIDDPALAQAYASADLFVLPSRYEGYGMAYAEALSWGIPIIAYAVGPLPELIGAQAGLLVAPHDISALSDALDLLLQDAQQRTHMAAAARQRAATLPTWDDTTRAFAAVLDEIARSKPRAESGK